MTMSGRSRSAASRMIASRAAIVCSKELASLPEA
jgi:hypothetical protein